MKEKTKAKGGKYKKEKERRKSKSVKLEKEELAYLSKNTKFNPECIKDWHKVNSRCLLSITNLCKSSKITNFKTCLF